MAKSVEALTADLELLNSMPVEEWAVRPELGALNLHDISRELEGVKRISRALLASDLSLLPERRRGDIASDIKNLEEVFKTISGFSINTGNPQETRKEL